MFCLPAASNTPSLLKYIVAVNITGPASGMGSHAKAQSQVVELAMARCEASEWEQ